MLISVVINTYNRADYLAKTLDSLLLQSFQDFEVVIVNGPSRDNTRELVSKFTGKHFKLRYFEIEKPNLSMSRNQGLLRSSGELVVYLDDDAIPHTDWLANIADFYREHKTENLGALAGVVLDGSGEQTQFKHGFIGIWGEVDTINLGTKDYNDAKGYYFNTVMGANSTFVKSALLAVGGFDETIEYYHDESDVCVRLIRKGFKVLPVNAAIVNHFSAPSANRDQEKQITSWNLIVKNRVYFALKTSAGYAPLVLRIIKPFSLEIGKFRQILKLKAGILKKLQIYLQLLYYFYKGYLLGLFFPRKLLKH